MIVTPRPRRAGGPPIWIGASAERAVRRAGRIADGFIASGDMPEAFGEQVRWAMDERGGRPFAVGLHMSTFAWNGPDAWEFIGGTFGTCRGSTTTWRTRAVNSGPSIAPRP